MDPSSGHDLAQTTTTAHPGTTFVKLCLLWAAFHHRSSPPPPACKSVLSQDSLLKLQQNGDLNRIIDSIGASKSPFKPGENAVFNNDLLNQGSGGGSHFKYTSRSLSVIGVLGGIVLILLVAALSTCIRNRRNLLLEANSHTHENFARQILIDHIRHLSRNNRGDLDEDDEDTIDRSNDVPPAYEDVVKDDHEDEVDANVVVEDEVEDGFEQPPSYIDAMERRRRALDIREELEMQTTSTSVVNSHVVTIEVNSSEDGALRKRVNSMSAREPETKEDKEEQ